MYETHFGLKKRPFRARATGMEVFVGPQTANTMAGFRKALAVQDAVVTVSGTAGTGKTTLVERAVDAMGVKYKTIRVGRMELDSSDVLEALLIVLGVQDYPAGTFQRFSVLRKKFKELEDREVRVFVLVEDALRAGAETLAELEALTAASAGESEGASIVLMGDERLAEFMRGPQLVQLQQRIRQRHKIEPLGIAELRGYLMHSFRLADGNFDQIFSARSLELLHELSGGIARIVNNLVDSTLTAAAAAGIKEVPATLIATVASDEYGLSVEDFDFSTPETATTEAAAKEEPLPAPVPEPAAVPELESDPVVDATPVPDPDSVEKPPQPPETAATDDEADIPHLINDTLPDLAILSPGLATPVEEAPAQKPLPEAEPNPAPAAEEIPELDENPVPVPVAEDIPELVAEPDPVPVVDDIPELMPEPELVTLVEDVPKLEPDPEPLDVVVDMPEPEQGASAEDIPELWPEPRPVAIEEDRPEVLPESPPVSVDENIPELVPESQLVPELVPELETDQSSDLVAEEPVRDPTLAELKPDLEALEQAMAFAQSGPLEDPEDELTQTDIPEVSVAEKDAVPEITLDKSIDTGIRNPLDDEANDPQPADKSARKPDPELGRIAAKLASPKSLEEIDDKMAETLFGTEISMIAAQLVMSPSANESANDELQLVEEKPQVQASASSTPVAEAVNEEVSLETPTYVESGGIDLGASQRLKTVRALSTNPKAPVPPMDLPPRASAGAGSAAVKPKESIEDQINTSITQTLKALKIPEDIEDDEPEDDKKKKSFFSRFRRS